MQRALVWLPGDVQFLGLSRYNFHSGLITRSRKLIKCLLETLFRRFKQYQMVRENQMVNSVASNNDTLVDSTVTLYPIHLD